MREKVSRVPSRVGGNTRPFELKSKSVVSRPIFRKMGEDSVK